MNIRQLTKTHWYIGESLVSFRQFGECTLNSRQHILWTFAICECPVGESLIGEIRVSRGCMESKSRFKRSDSIVVKLGFDVFFQFNSQYSGQHRLVETRNDEECIIFCYSLVCAG